MTREDRPHRHGGYGWGPPWTRPPWRGPPFRLSIPLAFIQVIGTSFAAHDQPEKSSLDALAFVLLIAGPIALAYRRRHPVQVLAFIFGVTLTYNLLDYPDGPVYLSLIAAGIAAAAFGHKALALATAVLGYFTFLWLGALLDLREYPSPAEVVAVAAWLIGIIAVAEMVRTRSERAIEAARTRREEAKRRASEERLRIAHELHDVLAHNISLINVQAGVALHLMNERPDQARTALSAIKDASDDALGELRSVLDILREGTQQAPRSPTPALNDLDELIDKSRSAGLDVTKSIEGSPISLPPNVERAAFRIVQEALTNTVRHSGGARAQIGIVYSPRELVVTIEDDGRGAASEKFPGGGNGIPGMMERASALGGDLEAGPQPSGGFRVRARLPLPDRSGAAS